MRTIWMTLAMICACLQVNAQQTVGLFLNSDNAYEGYTLFAPQNVGVTYLIDNEGREVHSWTSAYRPGNSAYLLPSGNLLRTAKDDNPLIERFLKGGYGGIIEEFAWDGTLVWSYVYSTQDYRQHHDIEPLPNGNVLLIAWELMSDADAIAEGRDPALIALGELWPESIIEVEPVGATSGNIVWEWHVTDHLIQDFDPSKSNFGVVADHPELVDFNAVRASDPDGADWLHVNGIAYNATLDQVMIGTPYLNELWIIDHSTTTAEAAGHTGGNSGKGGDLLYRWGNPQIYDRGDASDQALFFQHHPHWIEPGLPGAGNILIFNNGQNRPAGNFSTVDEIVPFLDMNGHYPIFGIGPYGPPAASWVYSASPDPFDLYSSGLSGAQRLPNGNTLICEGRTGDFQEVASDGTLVWRYVNPVTAAGAIAQGVDPASGNNVFRAFRYSADYPGLVGKDLTPGDPIEPFNRPVPTPSLSASRLTVAGDQLQIDWDATSCPAFDYNLIYGDLQDVVGYAMQGAECAIGITGNHTWFSVPSGDLYFLVVGTDDTGVYESGWGLDSSNNERNGTGPSGQCGVTTKDLFETCP